MKNSELLSAIETLPQPLVITIEKRLQAGEQVSYRICRYGTAMVRLHQS